MNEEREPQARRRHGGWERRAREERVGARTASAAAAEGRLQEDEDEESALHVAMLDPPAAFESGDSLADRSPPGMVRSNLSPRKAPLRWTLQQP